MTWHNPTNMCQSPRQTQQKQQEHTRHHHHQHERQRLLEFRQSLGARQQAAAVLRACCSAARCWAAELLLHYSMLRLCADNLVQPSAWHIPSQPNATVVVVVTLPQAPPQLSPATEACAIRWAFLLRIPSSSRGTAACSRLLQVQTACQPGAVLAVLQALCCR